jgi:hypothetical protein
MAIERKPARMGGIPAKESKATGPLANVQRSTILIVLMFLGGIMWVVFRKGEIDEIIAGANVSENMTVNSGVTIMEEVALEKNTREKYKELLRLSSATQAEMQNEKIEKDFFKLTFVKEDEPETRPATRAAPPKNGGENGGEKPPVGPKIPPVQGLVLKMVVLGRDPQAYVSVSGKIAIVKTGDLVGAWTVKLIERDSVTLEWKSEKNTTHQHKLALKKP